MTGDITSDLAIGTVELVVYVAAVVRLTFMLLYDSFPFQGLREWWLKRWPSSETEFLDDQVDRTDGVFHVAGRPNVPLFLAAPTPDGPNVWYAIRPTKLGELFECPWCMSMWAGLAVLAVWLAIPAVAWPLMIIGAASLVAGLLGPPRA